MGMDPQLKGQLLQAVQVQFSTATISIAGEPVLATATTMLCRYEAQARVFDRTDGTVDRTNHVLIFDAVTGFEPDTQTRFSLSTPAFDDQQPRQAKYINICIDERGRLSHYEIFL
jgi:hypothetical protein